MGDIYRPDTGNSAGSDDDLLIERFKDGDRAAFDEIYKRYKARILNYLYKLLGNKEAAEELAQETFIHLYIDVTAYQPRGVFRAWLYTVASNLAKNELKKRKRIKCESLSGPQSGETGLPLEDTLSDEHLSPEKIAENKELKEQIGRILRSIPPVYREAIVLCVVEGLSYEEAAAILHTNAKTLSSRLARGRELFISRIRALEGK